MENVENQEFDPNTTPRSILTKNGDIAAFDLALHFSDGLMFTQLESNEMMTSYALNREGECIFSNYETDDPLMLLYDFGKIKSRNHNDDKTINDLWLPAYWELTIKSVVGMRSDAIKLIGNLPVELIDDFLDAFPGCSELYGIALPDFSNLEAPLDRTTTEFEDYRFGDATVRYGAYIPPEAERLERDRAVFGIDKPMSNIKLTKPHAYPYFCGFKKWPDDDQPYQFTENSLIGFIDYLKEHPIQDNRGAFTIIPASQLPAEWGMSDENKVKAAYALFATAKLPVMLVYDDQPTSTVD